MECSLLVRDRMKSCAQRWGNAKVLPVCAWIVFSGMVVGTNAAQNPAHSLVSSGGSVAASSATHRLSGAVGQIASNRSQSTTHKLAGGFWNTVQLCDCSAIGDLNSDGVMNIFDVVEMVDIAFRNQPPPPNTQNCPLVTLADANCDGTVGIVDVVVIVGVAFRNTDERCDPCAP